MSQFEEIVHGFDSPARAAMRAVTETSEATRRELDQISDMVDVLAAERDALRDSRDWWADRCEELEGELLRAKATIEDLGRRCL